MAEILVIQHTAVETLGTFESVLTTFGHRLRVIHPYSGDPVPDDAAGLAGLIVLGGPMGVYEGDRYPFLAEETRLIDHALRLARPILGVCLGSQMLAAALGADVRMSAHKEIGWHPVMLSADGASDRLFRGLPGSFWAFHWHGDIFDLPRGAVLLARSERAACQAFRYGEAAYGLLFHVESTRKIVQSMSRDFKEEAESVQVDLARMRQQSIDLLPSLQWLAGCVIRRWANGISNATINGEVTGR